MLTQSSEVRCATCLRSIPERKTHFCYATSVGRRDVSLRDMFAQHSGTENAFLLCNVRRSLVSLWFIHMKIAVKWEAHTHNFSVRRKKEEEKNLFFRRWLIFSLKGRSNYGGGAFSGSCIVIIVVRRYDSGSILLPYQVFLFPL